MYTFFSLHYKYRICYTRPLVYRVHHFVSRSTSQPRSWGVINHTLNTALNDVQLYQGLGQKLFSHPSRSFRAQTKNEIWITLLSMTTWLCWWAWKCTIFSQSWVLDFDPPGATNIGDRLSPIPRLLLPLWSLVLVQCNAILLKFQ